jgi:recombination protein RecT
LETKTNAIEKAAEQKPSVDLAKPVENEKTVADLIGLYKRSMEMAAPEHLNVARFMRITLMEISKNKDLLKCSAGSLLGAVMVSAQLGLEIGGPLGQSYLVPFKRNYQANGQWQSVMEAQLIPGYKGLVKLARNSGEISSVSANVVYKQDGFSYSEGTNAHLDHEPNDDHDEEDRDIIAAYAIARFKDGGFQFVVIRRKRLDKIRKLSKAPDSPAWKEHLPEMFKKTAIRRLSKLLPLSAELAAATHLDSHAAMGTPQSINLLSDGSMPSLDQISATEPEDQQPPAEQAKGTAAVLIGAAQMGKFTAWMKKHEWSEVATRQMIKRECPEIDVSLVDLKEVLSQIPDARFEHLIEALQAGPGGKKEAAKKPEPEAKPEEAAVISQDQYDDLWAVANEKKLVSKVKEFAKKFGYKSLKEIRTNHLADVYEFMESENNQ